MNLNLVKNFARLLTLLMVLISTVSLADRESEQDEAQGLRQQGEIMSLQAILERAQKIHSGRVVEVELEREHNTYIYEIELVNSKGQVWKMKFNAKDASLLSSERED